MNATLRFTMAVMLAAGAASLPLSAAAADVAVREQQGTYLVSARFEVPQDRAAVLAVLTDYEQIPRYMPDVTRSVIRERRGARVIVEQEAVSRFLMFSKRVHLLLEIAEWDTSITFADTSGQSFSAYVGMWSLSEVDGHTVIDYQLSAKPTFDVPSFLLSRLLEKDATRMIARLRVEIEARAKITY
jgi:carbon monoxide dehydrogenase subunit G